MPKPQKSKPQQPKQLDDDVKAHLERILKIDKPQGRQLELMCKVIKKLFDPVIVGAENIPDKPCLFVGNHSLFAIDGYIIAPLMYQEVGRFTRPLLDRFLFEMPRMNTFFEGFGAALGQPEVCSALMDAKQDILLYPGGAYEAVKPASAMYQLQWRERYGFVRLAAQHGYTIMPFGVVGPDEMYGHLIEGNELPDTPLGGLLKRFGVLHENSRRDLIPPIPVGALGTLLPKPQRCFLGFGNPIDLSRYAGRKPTQRTLQKVRSEVAEEIEDVLADLLVTRARNRGNEGLLRRLLTI